MVCAHTRSFPAASFHVAFTDSQPQPRISSSHRFPVNLLGSHGGFADQASRAPNGLNSRNLCCFVCSSVCWCGEYGVPQLLTFNLQLEVPRGIYTSSSHRPPYSLPKGFSRTPPGPPLGCSLQWSPSYGERVGRVSRGLPHPNPAGGGSWV